jgi:glycosyltransferase involved in cell wall biosynthesis
MMAIVNAVAWVRQKPTIFVVDIDFRKDSTRYRRLGKWGIKSYIVNRYAYDPLKWIQVWFAVRAFDLVLLKSQSMVADFGRGRSNVRNFFDTVHGEFDVLSDAGLQQKLQTSRTRRPLRAAYFGRLVEYKGVALSVQAIDLARRRGADVELRIIGSGECREELKQLVRQLALAHVVEFVDPVPYGSELFDKLADVDVTIATPLVEDTPRGAFDSMARGIPIVAFDINYYSDLAHARAGVTTAKWPNVEAVASVLVDLAAERGRVESLAQEAVSFARKNTQDFWIRERSEWVNRALEARAKRSP